MRLSLVSAALCISILSACGGGGGGSPAGPSSTGGTGGNGGTGGTGNTPCPSGTICLRESSFDPTSLTVTRGSSVNFSNTSGIEHNVTFASGSGIQSIGNHTSGTNTRVFSTAGNFPFQCTLHAGMNGQIVVQ